MTTKTAKTTKPVRLPVHRPKCDHIYRFEWARYAFFCTRCGEEK
jgi:hypothetical protein